MDGMFPIQALAACLVDLRGALFVVLQEGAGHTLQSKAKLGHMLKLENPCGEKHGIILWHTSAVIMVVHAWH